MEEIWAQLPQASPELLGGWIVALAGLIVIVGGGLGIAVAIKTLRAPPPTAQTFVTHAEFEGFRTELRGELASVKADMKIELNGFKVDLSEKLKTLDTYIHEATHRNANGQQTIVAQIAELRGMMQMMRLIGRRKQTKPGHDQEENHGA